MKVLLTAVFASCLVLATSALSAQPVPCVLGYDAFKEKRYEYAIPMLDLCLKEDLTLEGRVFGHQLRASTLAKLKRWREAEQDQRHSIALATPTDVWAYLMLAVYLREDGRFEEALDALKSAMEFDEDGSGSGPGMAFYYHTGLTLQQLGRHDEAIEAFSLGIQKQPEYVFATFYRGISHEAKGDTVQAKRDFLQVYKMRHKNSYERKFAEKLMEYGFDVKIRE